MTSQDLLDHGGLGEAEARWQRHVVISLWISLAFLVSACIALLYANTHGLFRSTTDAPAPWSAEW